MKECQLDIEIVKYDRNNHYDSICEIDQYCMVNPWQENDFDMAFDDSLSFTFVAEFQDTAIGFVICDIDDQHEHIHVLRIAVLPKHQRRGVGTKLLQEAINKLRHDHCWELKVVVDDQVEDRQKVNACEFFKSCDLVSNYDETPPPGDLELDDLSLMYSYELPGHNVYKNRLKKFPF